MVAALEDEDLGDAGRAKALQEDNLRVARRLGDRHGEAHALTQLAMLAFQDEWLDDALPDRQKMDKPEGGIESASTTVTAPGRLRQKMDKPEGGIESRVILFDLLLQCCVRRWISPRAGLKDNVSWVWGKETMSEDG